MNYAKDKLDDALWEAKITLLRYENEESVHSQICAALIHLLAMEIANEETKRLESVMIANQLDPIDESDDLAESIRMSVFKTLKDTVTQWERATGC